MAAGNGEKTESNRGQRQKSGKAAAGRRKENGGK